MANRKVTVLNPAGYQEQLQSGDVAIFDNNNVVLGTNKITLLSGTGVAELTGSVQVGPGAGTGVLHTSVTPGYVSIYSPSGSTTEVLFKIKEGNNDSVTFTANGAATFAEGDITFTAAGAATFNDNITAAKFIGNGSLLTNLPDTAAGYYLALTGGDLTGDLTLGTNKIVLDAGTGEATFAGALGATTGTFSGALSATTATFSDALNGTTGTFSGALEAASVDGGTY